MFENRSTNAIYFTVDCKDTLRGQSFPLKEYNYDSSKNDTNEFYPQNRVAVDSISYIWVKEERGKKIIGCDSLLYIFVFKESLLKSQPWESIRNNRLFEKRLKYTQQDLDSINWNIVYR